MLKQVNMKTCWTPLNGSTNISSIAIQKNMFYICRLGLTKHVHGLDFKSEVTSVKSQMISCPTRTNSDKVNTSDFDSKYYMGADKVFDFLPIAKSY